MFEYENPTPTGDSKNKTFAAKQILQPKYMLKLILCQVCAKFVN